MTEARVPTPSDHQRDVVRGILARGMDLLDAKGHDYAADDSAFINFTLTGMILDWAVSRGVKGEDLAFVSDIASKLARLIELRGSGKTPKNETIEDTCMDLANYAALWGGWILTKKRQSLLECFDGIMRTEEECSKILKETLNRECGLTWQDEARRLQTDKQDWLVTIPKKSCEEEQPDLDLEAAKEARPWEVYSSMVAVSEKALEKAAFGMKEECAYCQFFEGNSGVCYPHKRPYTCNSFEAV